MLVAVNQILPLLFAALFFLPQTLWTGDAEDDGVAAAGWLVWSWGGWPLCEGRSPSIRAVDGTPADPLHPLSRRVRIVMPPAVMRTK